MPKHTKPAVKGKKAFPFAKKATAKGKKPNPFAKKAKK